jgi:pimeloyl-ACP methyl ester carboxylesterase
MNQTIRLFAFFCVLLTAYFLAPVIAQSQTSVGNPTVKLDTVTLFDSTRNRPIPVAFYHPKTDTKQKLGKQKLVIFSHGYGGNKGGDNLTYSYITEKLASEGYFVASIQHELPTDDLIPLTGVPQVVRRPFWERGVVNILFVLNALSKSHPALDFEHCVLMGHSNGGDMTALFAEKYPHLVDKIITLDNRRMALPRTRKPRVYSIRSSDQPADEGVLPTDDEQKKFGITIVKLPNTIHNDMGNSANAAQRKEINDYIAQFLQER